MPGFLLMNCSMTQEEFERKHWDEKVNGKIPDFIESKIEILDSKMLPDSGMFYIQYGINYQDRTLNPSNRLLRLYSMGFNIVMAWYRKPLAGCNKPGSTMITGTIYGEYLLICLPAQNDLLEKYNFRLIERPKSFPCPYNVSVFVPHIN
jgi:hypothetical protein